MTVVVALLVARLTTTPETRGSNPNIGSFIYKIHQLVVEKRQV